PGDEGHHPGRRPAAPRRPRVLGRGPGGRLSPCPRSPGDRTMARLRTFVAVDLGDAIRARCVALQEKLARAADGVKWVGPENLHVTLLFLGEVVDRDVPAVISAVAEAAGQHDAFALSVE